MVEQAGMQDRISIIHGNVLDADVEDATVVFVYLVPKGMALLKDVFHRIVARGGRIVSYGASKVVVLL